MTMARRKKPAGRPVYIVDGVRSPFLKAQGRQGPFKAIELAVETGKPLLLRQPFDASAFDEVIIGCVMPGPREANIARILALRLGCGEHMPAWTVQRNCASGMQALDSGVRNIRHGYADLVLAGGVESMSQSPLLLNDRMVNWMAGFNKSRTPLEKLQTLAQLRPGYFKPVIGLLCGLTDPVVNLSMGQTAEQLAYRFAITREEMDAYSVKSHQRLALAHESGLLSAEMVNVYDRHGGYYDHDTGVRPDSSMDKLARLKPFFDRRYGMVTPGNSSQITDGAALLILASEKAIEEHGLMPLAQVVDAEWAALDPAQMGLGPVHSMVPLLNRQRLKLDDIDYWEINEAFAAQVLACKKALNDDTYCREQLDLKQAFGPIPDDRLNVDGGGISIGHPVGASGARIVLHLMHTLQRTGAENGVASLCIGGGQGGAMLIRNIVT
jgi:acetyl-CoA C-acetyltransferase